MQQRNQRLNVVLSRAGVSSRRKADELISGGHVTIDGKTVRQLGTKVDPSHHEICVDGVPIEGPREKHLYFVLNKPQGVVTTLSDPEGRRTIREFLPKNPRMFPVGRLDYDAEGLLLVTTDGEMAHHLMHPKFGAHRTYLVKVKGKPSPETVSMLKRGVKLEDGFVKPLAVKFENVAKANTWFRMTVAEGRNRLIKRIWLRLDHPVAKLIRVEYAGIKLGDLPPGRLRPLTSRELKSLQELGD